MTTETPSPSPTTQTPAGSNPKWLGIVSLALGFLSFILALMPWVGVVVGVLAIVTGVVALVLRWSKGLAIGGIAIGAAGAAMSLVVTLVFLAYVQG